jgi:ribonucleoside-diphosphate reductase alpha chain
MRFEPAGLTDDPDVRMAQSIVDYVFRRLALDYLDFDTRSAIGIFTAQERARHLDTGSYLATNDEDQIEGDLVSMAQSPSMVSKPIVSRPVPVEVHSSSELVEVLQGRSNDAPICFTCGTKMRPAGSCYVCEGCGSTSGCS